MVWFLFRMGSGRKFSAHGEDSPLGSTNSRHGGHARVSGVARTRWPELFAQIGGALRGALEGTALRIDHIGSTRVYR
jgi:hypothetical protein